MTNEMKAKRVREVGMTNEMKAERIREVGMTNFRKHHFNAKCADALIKALTLKTNSLEDGFVADNLRMLAIDNWIMAEVKYDVLANDIASDMESTNGASWQYDYEELVEMILEKCKFVWENYQVS